MQIDHSKLVELVAEASGIEPEKAEKQLTELVAEIHQAIEDGDAYELDGFGIFSGIGSNIIFIPSDDLSTEINYKYVGMESIEMESPAVDNVEDLNEGEDQSEEIIEEEDPFAGLIDADLELEDDESDDDNEEPEDDDEHSIEEENPLTDEITASTEEGDDDFVDEFISGEETESEEEKPGPDKWGIDSYRDENSESAFSGLLGSDKYEDDETSSEPENEDDIFDLDDDTGEDDLSIQLDEDLDAENANAEEEDDNFDDPFAEFQSDEEEDIFAGEQKQEEDDDEEIVPVITNISSGSGEKEEPQKRELKQKTRSPRERQNAPVLLYILLAIVLLGGGIYGLGYFGLIDIPGINNQVASNQNQVANTTSTTPSEVESEGSAAPDSDPAQNEMPEDAIMPEEETSLPPAIDRTEEEVEAESTTEDVENSENNAAPDQSTFGLMGVPVDAANSGYTIVIYSLTEEGNAENQKRELTEAGYRTLILQLPHAQFGTIYRVSLGQFETMRDAAIAADKLSETYTDYFITEIQP